MNYVYFYPILLVFFALVVFLIFKMEELKKKHTLDIEKLLLVIDELLLVQNKQKESIILSEKSENKLQTSRIIIDKKILDLQNELITKLSDHKLID